MYIRGNAACVKGLEISNLIGSYTKVKSVPSYYLFNLRGYFFNLNESLM